MHCRHELTEREWDLIKPLIFAKETRRGRPTKNDRMIVNGMLWIFRTGAPWRDLPKRYGSWNTVYTRFYRWTKSGLWIKIQKELSKMEKKTSYMFEEQKVAAS